MPEPSKDDLENFFFAASGDLDELERRVRELDTAERILSSEASDMLGLIRGARHNLTVIRARVIDNPA